MSGQAPTLVSLGRGRPDRPKGASWGARLTFADALVGNKGMAQFLTSFSLRSPLRGEALVKALGEGGQLQILLGSGAVAVQCLLRSENITRYCYFVNSTGAVSRYKVRSKPENCQGLLKFKLRAVVRIRVHEP